jgi:hypothetical protein
MEADFRQACDEPHGQGDRNSAVSVNVVLHAI